MDRSIVERAQRGEREAYEALVRAASRRLYLTAHRIVRDADLADDATQAALVSMWRELPGLRDPDRFEAWLYRLVFRACIDMVRRRGRRPMEVELLPIDGPAGGDMASLIADRELLDVALKGLRPEWRAVMVLHYFLEMPLPDVELLPSKVSRSPRCP